MSVSRPKVAAVHTSPQTVLDDIARAMRLAEYQQHLSREAATALKINISWQHFYPACSTTPWQLDGVIGTLLADGFSSLVPVQNGTVVVDARLGEVNNGHKAALDRHHLSSVHLEEPPVRWVQYTPKTPLLALDRIFPEGIYIPDVLIGKNVVHLPTMKTHVFTTMTGSMKNAFGGLLNKKRHWTHSVIHETLVDLLTIQRDIHPGIFTVTDGTFAGDGPGPRAMRPYVKNLLLAGADPVAVDAVAARVMGFQPMSLKFLRLAHERGLGCADPAQIQMVGDDISQVNWHFSHSEDTLASRGQKLIYWGPLQPLEKLLLRSPIVPWSYCASNLYYNRFWYPCVGRGRVARAMRSGWGRLFQSYVQPGALPLAGPEG